MGPSGNVAPFLISMANYGGLIPTMIPRVWNCAAGIEPRSLSRCIVDVVDIVLSVVKEGRTAEGRSRVQMQCFKIDR